MNWCLPRMSLVKHGSSLWRCGRFTVAVATVLVAPFAATAEPIRHPTAIFAGLDKTTGRIINFEVAIDETVQFGTLQVTPRVCNTRPQTEAPQTTSFVEVDETVPKSEAPRDARGNARNEVKTEAKRIFSGWMFAASPGLHGVEHPVYDVWLTDCKGGKETVAAPVLPSEPDAATATATDPAASEAAGAADSRKRSKRSRRIEPMTPAPIEPEPIGPPDQPDPIPGAQDPAVPEEAASPPPPAEPPAPTRRKRRRSAPRAATPAAPALPFPF
jgi:hypothetical protein